MVDEEDTDDSDLFRKKKKKATKSIKKHEGSKK